MESTAVPRGRDAAKYAAIASDPAVTREVRAEAAAVAKAASAKVAARAKLSAQRSRLAARILSRSLRQLGKQGDPAKRRAADSAVKAADTAARQAQKSAAAAERAAKYGTPKQAADAADKAAVDARAARNAATKAARLLKEAIDSGEPPKAPADGAAGEKVDPEIDWSKLTIEEFLLWMQCGGLCTCNELSCPLTHACRTCRWDPNPVSIGGGKSKLPDSSIPGVDGAGSPPPDSRAPDGGRSDAEDGSPQPESSGPLGGGRTNGSPDRYAPPGGVRKPPEEDGSKKQGGEVRPDDGDGTVDEPPIRRILDEIGKKPDSPYRAPEADDFVQTASGPEQPWTRTGETWRFPCTDRTARSIYFRPGPSSGTFVVCVWIGRKLVKSAPLSAAEVQSRWIAEDTFDLCNLLMEPGIVDERTAFSDAVAALYASLSDKDRALLTMMMGAALDAGLLETMEKSYHGEKLDASDAWNVASMVLPDAVAAGLKKAGKSVKEAFDWLRGKLKSAKADLGNVRPKGMPDAPPRKQVAGSDGAPPAQSKDAPEPTPAASSAPKPTANGAGKTSARGPATATDPPPPKQPDPSGGGGHVVQNGGDDYAKSPSPEGIDPGTPQPPVRPVPDAKAPDAAPAGAGGGSERVRAQEPDVGGGERSGGG